MQDLARQTINEISDGKGDACFRLSQEQGFEFEALLNQEFPGDKAKQKILHGLLVQVTESGHTYREAIPLLLGIMTPARATEENWVPIVRALQRSVLSRALMEKVQKVFEDSENRDEWEARLQPLESRSIMRTDPVFEALCNALQEAINSARMLSPDEVEQHNQLTDLIAAAKAECRHHRDAGYSVKQLLWESAQVMAGELPAAADNLKYRRALLDALLPTQIELKALWQDKRYPMGEWAAWRDSDNRLPSQMMGPVRLEVLKAIAEWALRLSVHAHYPFTQDELTQGTAWKLQSALGHEANPERENGLSAKQKHHLSTLATALSIFEDTQYPDGKDRTGEEQLEVFIKKVLTTSYEDRDKKTTSALEYLLNEILPSVSDPLLKDVLNKVDVDHQEQLLFDFRNEFHVVRSNIRYGSSYSQWEADNRIFYERSKNEEFIVTAMGDFIRQAVAEHKGNAVLPSQEQPESAYPTEFSVLKEHLRALRDRRSVILVEEIAQRLIDSEGDQYVGESLTGKFIRYLRDDLAKELAHLKGSSTDSQGAWKAEEIEQERQEILELDLKLGKLEAQGSPLFTYRELARVVTEVMKASNLPEDGHSSEPKVQQLRLYRTLLEGLLPVHEGTGWNRDWQKLYSILNSGWSKKVTDPLTEVLQNFVENMHAMHFPAGAQHDELFLALVGMLDPVLQGLEKEKDKLTSDEQEYVKTMRFLLEAATFEDSKGEDRYSPDTLIWELTRLVHGVRDNRCYSARRALLEKLVPITWGKHEGRPKQHEGFWGKLADYKPLEKRLLSEEMVHSMGKILLDGLQDSQLLSSAYRTVNFSGGHSDKPFSVLSFLSLVDRSLLTDSERGPETWLSPEYNNQHPEFSYFLRRVNELYLSGDYLSWNELKGKVVLYLETPEKERSALFHSVFDELLHQVLPSHEYGWSEQWTGLVATWNQQPVSDTPDAYRDQREVVLLTDAMASDPSRQADAVPSEIHAPSSRKVESLSPALVMS